MVFSPHSANSYEDVGEGGPELQRVMWMSVVVGDLALKCLL